MGASALARDEGDENREGLPRSKSHMRIND
jgi:hypothetical protein